MDYFEICIYTASEEKREILTSLLAEEGFESFVETKDELLAYISVPNYSPENVKEICDRYDVKFTEKRIADQNWNVLWEKNFEPVVIAEKCYVRAPFHSSHPEYPYEIIIEPKMSFGTAHHETTAMMIEEMLQMDLKNKKVLDVGCGTGILSILANKSEASDIDAIDNDSWAYNNALENVERNRAHAVKVRMGDVDTADEDYEVILANINRNVLLSHLHEYSKRIKKGELLMSGFYEDDLPMIRQEAEKNGFVFDHYITKNRWTAARFIK
jgi:ribosomal protein L11 methyltransferase